MNETTKSKISVSIIQICIAVILIIMAISMPRYSRYIEYRNGLSGEGPGTSVLLLLLYLPLIGFLGLSSIVAGLIHIFRQPRSTGKGIIAVILVLVPTIIAGISSGSSATGRTDYFLDGFSKWVVVNVDLDKFEKWHPNVADKFWGEFYRYDFPEELPEFATSFKPKFIVFSKASDDTNDRSIRFSWGGGLSEWGFVITEPSEKASKPGEITVIQTSESMVEVRRNIRPGIYVFESF